jgi:glycine cleavage system regulatory protein
MVRSSSPIERYDPLAQFMAPPAAPSEPVNAARATRVTAGCALLAASLAAGAWLVTLVHAIVFRPETVGLLQRLAPAKVEDLTLTLPAGKVELPAALTTVVAYVLVLILTSIVAKLIGMLIKHGVSLLREERKEPEPSKPEPDLPPLNPVETR